MADGVMIDPVREMVQQRCLALLEWAVDFCLAAGVPAFEVRNAALVASDRPVADPGRMAHGIMECGAALDYLAEIGGEVA